MFEYLPFFDRGGLKVEVQSLLPDDYLRRRYGGKGVSARLTVAAYCKRLNFLLTRSRSRAIWLEKELWPYIPFGVERQFLRGRRYAVDIDDAVFHNYDNHRSRLIRHMLGRKVDSIFRHASLVTAGSSYLARRAVEAEAPWVEILPTVVNFGEYQFPRRCRQAELTVGWIGSPATQHFLSSVAGVLAEILSEKCNRFVTIGSSFKAKLFENHEEWTWRRDAEAQQISRLDVGVMPVSDGPFERGKCGYKLIQYMACGIPVVASPVGANVEIVRHGENGFLAQSQEEWRRALIVLKENAELRRRMGEAGRRMVKNRYSLETAGPKVVKWLTRIAAGSRPQSW